MLASRAVPIAAALGLMLSLAACGEPQKAALPSDACEGQVIVHRNEEGGVTAPETLVCAGKCPKTGAPCSVQTYNDDADNVRIETKYCGCPDFSEPSFCHA